MSLHQNNNNLLWMPLEAFNFKSYHLKCKEVEKEQIADTHQACVHGLTLNEMSLQA